MRRSTLLPILLLLCAHAWAQGARPQIALPRAPSPIAIDGDLSDAAWSSAARIETFYEYQRSDNGPPPVPTTAFVMYDDRYFYVGIDCRDPEPAKIRAPYVDRDHVFGDQDNVAVLIDARGEGKVALQLRSNPRGIQADAVNNDSTGSEDFSPDFFYDTAAKITSTGWTVEFRIPLSTLRYQQNDPKTWGLIVLRNWPRDFRYTMSSSPLPRGASCFVCQEMQLTGITNLPSSQHLVTAPYVRAEQTARPEGAIGTSLRSGGIANDAGVDVKWSPGPDTAVDATLNPDFSQVEADVAQISTNERFALFFPEKRPFFLEGSDLLETPIQAVYTRTITSPRWGLRATGKNGATTWTMLVADDRGGGSVIIPGPLGSLLVPQESESIAAIGRARHEIGRSAVGMLVTDRENRGGNGHNRVLGPDFEWRPNERDVVTGELLFSNTVDPLVALDGTSHYGRLLWTHATSAYDWAVNYEDRGDDFRADNGFVPEVGDRYVDAGGGWNFYPKSSFFIQLRPAIDVEYTEDNDGNELQQDTELQFVYRAKRNVAGFFSFHPKRRARADNGDLLTATQLTFSFSFNPGARWPVFGVGGQVGEDFDFTNSRPARSWRLNFNSTFRPADKLQLEVNSNHQSLRSRGLADDGPLFVAQVERIKATYSFTAKSLLRVIGQYVDTRFSPRRYPFVIPPRSGSSLASILYSYRLNWQTVLFAGYGDDRTVDPEGDLLRADRTFFLKISYAFQR